MANEPFNSHDIIFLNQVSQKEASIKEKLHGVAADLLLKSPLDDNDDMMLKLSISSIVNILQPASYNFFEKKFTKKEMKTLENFSDVEHTGLSSSDKQLMDEIIQIGGDKVDKNLMMVKLLSEQLSLYQNNLAHTDRCKALDILKSIIEISSMTASTDSENTAYRHYSKHHS
ncbi:hypothetical protein INT47_005287 [Mucor saturninus]|uniref:Uncharacterized protein n=1 Tax=Mucor saturninus TaxID=64648 RepID=A0A8H7R7V4_9FUNG|nr:hypothetical protein INT47_005287 [Mucor saturninus]